jgi:hypothetical protein
MRRMLLLLGGGVLAAALGANAQYPYAGARPYNAWQGRERGERGRDAGLIDRVLRDLDRARSDREAERREHDRFDQARRNLLRFEDNWSRGRFDKDRLDGAIDDLHHLSNSNHLRGRDRDMLARDMQALRDFRASGGRYEGYRGRY